ELECFFGSDGILSCHVTIRRQCCVCEERNNKFSSLSNIDKRCYLLVDGLRLQFGRFQSRLSCDIFHGERDASTTDNQLHLTYHDGGVHDGADDPDGEREQLLNQWRTTAVHRSQRSAFLHECAPGADCLSDPHPMGLSGEQWWHSGNLAGAGGECRR